jgi:formylglycine-generating enzyme required for sulfatase activity
VGPEDKVFDLVRGMEAKLLPNPEGRFSAEAICRNRGIGCLVAGTPEALGGDFLKFLSEQNRRFLGGKGDPWNPKTQLQPLPFVKSRQNVPGGMAEIQAAEINLQINIRVRECGFYKSVPQPGHSLASSYNFQVQSFQRRITLSRYAIDITPVTNSEYKRFLDDNGYRPQYPEHFLRHWKDGIIPQGKENHPVVYVDLDDARAYARWAGKRVPTEEQWQYAAQGTDGRLYPWGNAMEINRCNAGQTGNTTSVDAFPCGRSPFGILDMCGNTWEWTESEYSDGRTRFCMIRGGSFYQAKGSGWYMDGGPRPVNFAEKFLRMWPGLDRCATVGFRCVLPLD